MPMPLSSYTPTDHIIVLLSAEYNKGVFPHRFFPITLPIVSAALTCMGLEVWAKG